jgi:cobalt-zinc-cadmium efflux system membrane fusion protein
MNMERIALLIVCCALVSGLGCQESGSHEHGENPHEEHAGHNVHSGDERDHEEHADEGHEEGRDGEGARKQVVEISPEALARSGIRLGKAEAGVLAGALEVPAEVQLNPDRVAHVSPLVDGQLLSVDVSLGDRVEAETQLAQLRSVELGQARAELSRTSSLLDGAKQNRKRQRRLREEGISSERSLLEAELAYEQAHAEREAALSRLLVFGLMGGSGPDMNLASPIAGLVVERHATRGENVSPGDTLFIVADLSRVWVIGRVYEQQVDQIAPGMSAALTLNAYPGHSWSGEVDFVGAVLDESTRTLPIRVEIENPEGLLRPGLFGSLRLTAAQPTGPTVLVPLAAIQTLEGQAVVFVPGGEEGEFEAHPVTVGREGNRLAEVLEGLEQGARIVVEGAFILKSELMRGELGHGHAH